MKNGTPCQRQLSTDSHVAHGPLAQTVIDPEDARFIECPEEDRVEGAGGTQIPAEGLLQNDARARRPAAGAHKLFHDCSEERRRNGEIVRWLTCCSERGAQGAKGRRIRVVAVDILQQ